MKFIKLYDNFNNSIIVYHGTTNNNDNDFIPYIINWEDEVGAHFASNIKQAKKAIERQNQLETVPSEEIVNKKGKILKYEITLNNPLRVNDIGRWYPNRIFDKIIEPSNLKYEKVKYYKGLGELKINNRTPKEIIDIFHQNGYDGLVYNNKYEGGGDSYVVFDKSQIKPL